LRESLGGEGIDRPWIAALATIGQQHYPHVRHIICRQIDDEGILWIASDARSEKNQQIRSNPSVELAFWLPAARQQYRIGGDAEIFGSQRDHPLREMLWRSFTDSTRALFHWPHPGAPRTQGERAFVGGVKGHSPVSPALELICVRPAQVDLLELGYLPHRRRRWRGDAQWIAEELNP
jgi:pyridoxamine 5'-phosphate oxidase